jgi:hypothetical protein
MAMFNVMAEQLKLKGDNMRYLTLVICIVLFATSNLYAGYYSYDCSKSAVSCDNLFSDIVTEKYTKTFDNEKWDIFVYSATNAFSDGSGLHYAIVGVVPSKSGIFPKRWWQRVNYKENIGNSFAQKDGLGAVIRTAIEAMMASCEDSPDCNIVK